MIVRKSGRESVNLGGTADRSVPSVRIFTPGAFCFPRFFYAEVPGKGENYGTDPMAGIAKSIMRDFASLRAGKTESRKEAVPDKKKLL